MAKKTFSSEYQPARRGRGPVSATQKLRDALERKFASGDVEGYTTFDDWLVDRALAEGGIYLQIVANRAVPNYKPTLEPIKIDYPKDGTAVEKAEAVYSAVADGEVPADVGSMLIDSLSKLLAIEEITELKARLDKLEAIVNKN